MDVMSEINRTTLLTASPGHELPFSGNDIEPRKKLLGDITPNVLSRVT